MCLKCVLNIQHPYTKFRNFCISHNFHYQIVECKVCDAQIQKKLTIINIDDLPIGVQLLNNTLFHIFKQMEMRMRLLSQIDLAYV
jgi:hypothetical protein